MKTCEEVIQQNKKLKEQNGKLEQAIKDIWELIDNSNGVQGLHKNGNLAHWDDLLKGGNYPWLASLPSLEELEKGSCENPSV